MYDCTITVYLQISKIINTNDKYSPLVLCQVLMDFPIEQWEKVANY